MNGKGEIWHTKEDCGEITSLFFLDLSAALPLSIILSFSLVFKIGFGIEGISLNWFTSLSLTSLSGSLYQ